MCIQIVIRKSQSPLGDLIAVMIAQEVMSHPHLNTDPAPGGISYRSSPRLKGK